MTNNEIMDSWINFLMDELKCYADENGNRPCDNGAICDRCSTEEIYKDAVGNIVAELPASKENAPTLLLEAHMDEIGFIVTSIDEKGFLKVK